MVSKTKLTKNCNLSDIELINWIVNNSSKYKLKVTNYNWIKKWLNGFYDYGVQLTIRGSEFAGRGIDQNEEIAIAKACAEAIERTIFSHDDKLSTTNGIAVHIDKKMAEHNAKKELIERDCFLCHFLTKIPFQNLLLDDFYIGKVRLKDIESRLNKIDIEIKLLKMRSNLELTNIACVVTGFKHVRPFGLVLGTASCDDIQSAVVCSVIECLRNVISFVEGTGFESITLKNFYDLIKPNSLDHFRLALNLNYWNIMKPFFNKTNYDTTQYDIKLNDLDAITTGNMIKELDEAPAFFSIARSPKLQPVFWGRTTKSKVNIMRLKAFAKKDIKYSYIEKLPHPFS